MEGFLIFFGTPSHHPFSIGIFHFFHYQPSILIHFGVHGVGNRHGIVWTVGELLGMINHPKRKVFKPLCWSMAFQIHVSLPTSPHFFRISEGKFIISTGQFSIANCNKLPGRVFKKGVGAHVQLQSGVQCKWHQGLGDFTDWACPVGHLSDPPGRLGDGCFFWDQHVSLLKA